MAFNNDVTFKITEHIGTFGGNGNWTREINRVSWNDADPVFDLRAWNADHTRCTKGFTFSDEEAPALCKALNEYMAKAGK